MASAHPEFAREQYLERPLPSSEESERVILGAILLDNALITQAVEQLKPEDFYSPKNRRIYNAMISLFEKSERLDPILIGEELKKDGQLESIGGVAAITNLTYGLPHFSNIHDYAKVVRDKSIVRNLIKVCNLITSEALAEEEDAREILDHAEQLIFALADERNREGFAHIKPVAETVLHKVQEFAKRESHALTGLATGFRDLDQMTSGLQPSDLIIIAARPSMGKCLEENSEILLTDGSVSTIKEIYAKKEAKLLTLGEDYKFSTTAAVDFIDDGIKPVFRVETRLGRMVETTITHPFLTIEGWKKLEQIEIGEKIAVPRILNTFGNKKWRNCEVKILGYLLGDGCLTKNSIEFTNENIRIQKDFAHSVMEFGGVEANQSNSSDRACSYRIRKTKQILTKKNPLTVWIEKLQIKNCNSHTKFIPSEVFTLNKEQIALFLNRLFATDGWASVLKTEQVQLGFASVSEKMIRQVQHLLLRFGIIANLKKRRVKYKHSRNTAWQLDITDAKSIKIFIEEIGMYGKDEIFPQILEILEKRNYQTNKDLIPMEVWDSIAESKGNESWTSLAKRAEIKGYTNIHVGKREPTRQRLSLLANALENKLLQNLSESEIYWDEIISIEYVGNKQVYDLTIPETHNFVANDICVHNTALCLTIAQNAAIQENATIALFSLEMSKEQLVMRMLSSEARVDAHRFRTGYLSREEWGRLASSIGTLSETSLFIDDTPGISVLEMRAKARRLAAEQKKLDLIIVDYMQLMSGSKRTESRQQEVSQISRELKGLAKELNVPLIALSQLSRAPEARNPPKPMLSDLRESGCLTGDSLVTMADTGERIQIKDLVGKKDFYVWALNENTWQIKKAKVINSFCTGKKSIYQLKTRLGRTIKATGNHKFYSFNGWKRLDKFQLNERLALPREIKSNSKQTVTNEELALLAHLIGDGCTLPRHSIQYTTREIDLAETVIDLAIKVFGNEINPRIKKERNWYQVYLTSTRKHTHNVHSAVAEWLDDLKVWGLRSHEKFVPKKVFRQSKEAIALFLKHLWVTDGCIKLVKGKKIKPVIYYASSSKRLCEDVQALLLRLGINATLKKVLQGNKGKDQFHIILSGKPDIERFIKEINTIGEYKKNSLSEIEEFLENKIQNTNRDIIPNTAWRKYVVPSMKIAGITTRKMMAEAEMSYCGTSLYKQNLGRERAERFAKIVNSEELLNLSLSDIYWDEIVSIEAVGVEEVYDLTVEKYANFESNGFIVHNSIEQDADVVAFIYREEYYAKDPENLEDNKKNVAEILISKQRNGPTGTVKLAFLKEFTRFESYLGE
ncbi:MAG: replicative DNA helicase [Aridibacter sp.]